MATKKKKNLRSTTCFKGDAAEYTGNTVQRFGKTFFEVEITEGRNKGDLRVVAQAPGADDVTEAPAAPLDERAAAVAEAFREDAISGPESAMTQSAWGKVEAIDAAARAECDQRAAIADGYDPEDVLGDGDVSADPASPIAGAEGWTDEALRDVNEQPVEKTKRKRAPKKDAEVRESRPTRARHHQLEPGRTLTRMFKGAEIHVEITEHGFEWDGRVFKSISACAKAITGYGISGPVFFGLDVDGSKQPNLGA